MQQNVQRPPIQYTERQPKLIVAVGRKGVGKTHETINYMRYYIQTIHNKALIFDVNNEKLYKQFRTISLSNLRKWSLSGKPEIRRISVFKAKEDLELTLGDDPVFLNTQARMITREQANALNYILMNFSYGLLTIEDMTKYISDSLPADIIGSICTQRHNHVDIMIHFQTLGKFGNPKILGNTNCLRFHKTNDTVSRHENKFNEYVQPLMIAEQIVNKRYHHGTTRAEKSFFVYFDLDDYRIKGNFSEKEFAIAIINYLSANYDKTVKSKMNEKDVIEGKNKFKTHKEATTFLVKQYFDEYYGNPRKK